MGSKGSYLLLSIGAIVVLLPVGLSYAAWRQPIGRTLRIGFQNSPPYHFPDEQGNATGPAVQLLREAARRQHIDLQWVFSPQGPEKALASGAVDLWPLMVDSSERRKTLYITAPWARTTYALIYPQAQHLSNPREVSGKRVAAITKIAINGRIVQQYLPGATVVPERVMADVVEAVCSGTAQAGMVSMDPFVDLWVNGCQIGPLGVLPIEGATFWFGVGANKHSNEAMRAADLLRDEIGAMAEDGSLVAIDFRWNAKISLEVSTIFGYRRARFYSMVLLSALGVLAPTDRKSVV